MTAQVHVFMMADEINATPTAVERKRKRLEAWRRRQEQQAAVSAATDTKKKISLSFNAGSNNKKKKKRTTKVVKFDTPELLPSVEGGERSREHIGASTKRNRWDMQAAEDDIKNNSENDDIGGVVNDDLDVYMKSLESKESLVEQDSLSIDIKPQNKKSSIDNTTPTNSGGVITPEELASLHEQVDSHKVDIFKGHNVDQDTEEEESRRAFIQALQKAKPLPAAGTNAEVTDTLEKAQTMSEVQSHKHRKEERLKDLQIQAKAATRANQEASEQDFGRIYYSDVEGGVMEEAERALNVINNSQDALEILAEINKKKELKSVDHSSVEYIPIRKNLYICPRSLAGMSEEDVADFRAKLGVKVRGRGAPVPVRTFTECGLSERIMAILAKQNIYEPFPIQAQCLPCIMAGRDVIGIAKTGSGKTLAYLLPMLRHIGDQPELAPHESGPIGLILCPARELAVQIHHVTKSFCKHLGLKSTSIYGGAGVAEQIADLKRGTEIVVATPGRMIDILTMQSGKILSLERVSSVTLDEADRMFDMGFAPQISAILSSVRPDRQTVLFSGC